MARSQDGDRAAFGALVHRHVDALYGYARRLVGHPVVAEDLVQDAWLSAWQQAHRYNPRKASVRTWLYRILHNRCIDQLRAARPHETLGDEDLAAPSPDSDAELEQLSRALDGLAEQQRAAIALTYLSGFSNRECARILGVRLRAFESLLARARGALRKTLDRHEPGSDIKRTTCKETQHEHLR